MKPLDYHPNLRNLTPYQYWLLQHQITAFWHGFGISNGIYISRHDLQEGRYRGGEAWLRVRPERMRKELREYVKWLESYKLSWNRESTSEDIEMYSHGLKSLLEDERKNPERPGILRMISLLQNNAWVEGEEAAKERGNGSI